MPLGPLLTPSSSSGFPLAGSLGLTLGLEGELTVAVPIAGEMGLSVDLEGTIHLAVPLSGSLGIMVGAEADLMVDGKLDSDLGFSVGLEGTLTVAPALVEIAGAMGLSVGLSGILGVGPALPATTWTWGTPEPDRELLRTLRVRLATLDGEYVTVDPAALADLRIVLSRKGGVESIEVTLARDSRIDYGDLDYWTKCEVEYLGRVWPAFIREASLSHERSSMTRSARMLGHIAKLSERHKGFRKVYVDSRLSAVRTDQGPQTGSQVFEVSAHD